jgi:hypothetical protein
MGRRQTPDDRDADRRRDEGEPGVGRIGLLLRAVHGGASTQYTSLYDAVLGLQTERPFDASELVELSIKLSPRGFSQRRYGASLTWQPRERGLIAQLAREAAPTDVLREALARPAPSEEVGLWAAERDARGAAAERPKQYTMLREWVGRTTRHASAIACDFDARLYKLYLFKHRPIRYFEDLDLDRQADELPAASYIRCLEIGMDDPDQQSQPLYFKLRGGQATGAPAAALPQEPGSRKLPHHVLDPDYSPHPQLRPRLLSAVKQRDKITEPLERLLDGMPLHNDPVVKLVLPATRAARAALDYGVNLNLLAPTHIRFVEEQADCILGVARVLGCLPQAKDWLLQVAPFDCFLSYLGLGPDSVTFYYRSTIFHRGQRAAHRVRVRGSGSPRVSG